MEDEVAAHLGKTCAFVEVIVDNWRRVFLCTTREVPKGMELLVSYGDDYWPSHDRLMAAIERAVAAKNGDMNGDAKQDPTGGTAAAAGEC